MPRIGPALKPRRTHASTDVYRLQGGTEDNDLWVEIHGDKICSTWELTDEHRKMIAEGANICLTVWGGQPPVSIGLTNDKLGKKPGI